MHKREETLFQPIYIHKSQSLNCVKAANSDEGDISEQNRMKAIPYNKIMQRQYFRTKLHEGDVSAKQWSIEHLRTTRSKPSIQNQSNESSQYQTTTMKNSALLFITVTIRFFLYNVTHTSKLI
jgi:hypothetical protein